MLSNSLTVALPCYSMIPILNNYSDLKLQLNQIYLYSTLLIYYEHLLKNKLLFDLYHSALTVSLIAHG